MMSGSALCLLGVRREAGHGGQRQQHARGRDVGERFGQRVEAIVGGVQAVVGMREVDGNEARRSALDVVEQGPLEGKAAQQIVRQAGRVRQRDAGRERIRHDVIGAGGVAVVQRRLGDDDRPIRVALAHELDEIDDGLLLRIHGAHGDQHEMRAVFGEGEILGRVVAGFAQPARIEEAQDRGVGGKLIEAGRARAGAEAVADRGVVCAGDAADDRGLAALHLAEQPDDGRDRTRAFDHGIAVQLGFEWKAVVTVAVLRLVALALAEIGQSTLQRGGPFGHANPQSAGCFSAGH